MEMTTAAMRSPADARLTRREALVASARYAAAGGIVVLSAGLIAKGFLVPEAARCGVAAACRSCRSVAECGLPAAVQFRQEDGHSRLSHEPSNGRQECLPSVSED
jgi:hypothetical protein